jgi:acetyl-CoA carboxylase biotin carboxyl carrier protein
MSAPDSETGDIFDVRNFRQLVELMKQHDLNEVDLRKGNARIRLRRGAPEPRYMGSPVYASGPTVTPSRGPETPIATPSAGDIPKALVADKSQIIKSPTVGTFYSSPNPESPPFVKVGDTVGPETVICIIEAMKVFNEVPAECHGKIAEILVQNGDSVEFGQALFRVEPR